MKTKIAKSRKFILFFLTLLEKTKHIIVKPMHFWLCSKSKK